MNSLKSPLIAILFVCFFINLSSAQTNPEPHLLRLGNYQFSGFSDTNDVNYPPSMVIWTSPQVLVAENEEVPGNTLPLGNEPLQNFSSDMEAVSARNEGVDGISLLQKEGFGRTDYPGMIVLSLNTKGVTTVAVSWAAHTQFDYFPDAFASIQLQYRVGTTGDWANISGHRYSSKTVAAGGQLLFESPVTIMGTAVENKDVVQLRWIYFFEYESPLFDDWGDRITIYNISVTSSLIAETSKPAPDFTADKTTIDLGEAISFTDLSTNNPTSWEWNFGDAETASVYNPTHTYTQPGIYNVKLKVANAVGEDSIQKIGYVIVNDTTSTSAAPEADFSHLANALAVDFNDQSTNTPTDWAWSFGDGNTSAMQNPSNTYATPGTYNVRLIASNSIGSDTVVKTVTVTSAVIKPSADFTYQASALAVDFEDQSTNSPVSWEWDFGDGNTSAVQNPSNTYAAPGTYNVRLIASNSAGSDTVTKAVTANAAVIKPEADFDHLATALSVVFEDQSNNAPSSWEWDFGDGGTSADQDPFHTYNTAGTYAVRLIATNIAGSDTVTKDVTVTASVMVPEAAFSFTEDNATVDFKDESTNSPTTWEWDFGDGSTSTLKDPQHTYTQNGVFSVCLIASNSAGSDTVCQDVTTLIDGVASIDHSSMQIYPNPSTGIISIDFGTAFTGEADLKVINVLGKVVKVLTINENSTQLDMQDVEPGAYMLVLDIDDQRFVSRLQIVR